MATPVFVASEAMSWRSCSGSFSGRGTFVQTNLRALETERTSGWVTSWVPKKGRPKVKMLRSRLSRWCPRRNFEAFQLVWFGAAIHGSWRLSSDYALGIHGNGKFPVNHPSSWERHQQIGVNGAWLYCRIHHWIGSTIQLPGWCALCGQYGGSCSRHWWQMFQGGAVCGSRALLRGGYLAVPFRLAKQNQVAWA